MNGWSWSPRDTRVLLSWVILIFVWENLLGFEVDMWMKDFGFYETENVDDAFMLLAWQLMRTRLSRESYKMGTVRLKKSYWPKRFCLAIWLSNILYLLQIPDFAYSPNPHSEYSISFQAFRLYFVDVIACLLLTQMGVLGHHSATILKQNENQKQFLAKKLPQNRRHQSLLLLLLLKTYGYEFITFLESLTF